MASRPRVKAIGKPGPIQWHRSYLSATDGYGEHDGSGGSYEGMTDVDSDDDEATKYIGSFSCSESDGGDALGSKVRRKRSHISVLPQDGVTVTVPPLPQVGTALQSNVRRLGRAQEEKLMRLWGGEAHGKTNMAHRAIIVGDDGSDDDVGVRLAAVSRGGLRLRFHGDSDEPSGKSSEEEGAGLNAEKSEMQHLKTRRVEIMEAKREKDKKIVLDGKNHEESYYKGGALSVVTIRKGDKFLKSAHSQRQNSLPARPSNSTPIPTIVLGPPPAEDQAGESQDPNIVLEVPSLPASKTSFRWGRRILEASPRLTHFNEFQNWCKKGTEFTTANIRIGFADGLFDYPSAEGYSWILESMLSDPLVLQLDASLHAVAWRPEFTVDCRWLTENDLFIIIDTLSPGDLASASYPEPKYCNITGEPLSRRRFRTPNNRPFIPLGGWTGGKSHDSKTQRQYTFVERYFIWVNRDGKTVKEGSARWPPSSARKKSSTSGLTLPENTPKEQYSVIIGHDSGFGFNPTSQADLSKDDTSGLKILERHIKVKLETDKDWLRKMIQAPAYWIIQEIITTLLDGKLKGLLGEARRRVNKERKRALEANSLTEGVLNLSCELDVMQELVGIMEEYIRFVSGFEVAYHNVNTHHDSDSGSSIGPAPKKKVSKKKAKKKRGIPPPDKEVKREFMMLRRSLEGYRDCLVDIKEDIEYTIHMVFSTAQAQQSSDALEQSGLAYTQAENMSKQTRMVMHQTDKMTHQAQSMRRLTYLALFFLPASFIATIFGMNVFELIAPSIWIFFAVAAPTTIIVFGAAYWYDSTREMVPTADVDVAGQEVPDITMHGFKQRSKSEANHKESIRWPLANRYTGTLHKRGGNIQGLFTETPAIQINSPPKDISVFDDKPANGTNPQQNSGILPPTRPPGNEIEKSIGSQKNSGTKQQEYPHNRMSSYSGIESPRTVISRPNGGGYFQTHHSFHEKGACSPSDSLAPSISSQPDFNKPNTTVTGPSQDSPARYSFEHSSSVHNPDIPMRIPSHRVAYGYNPAFLDTRGKIMMGSRRGSLLEPEPNDKPNANSFNSLFVEGGAAKARARQRSIHAGVTGLDEATALAYAIRAPSKEIERRISQRYAVEDSHEYDEPNHSPRIDANGRRRNKWGIGKPEKGKEVGPEEVV